MNGVVAPFFLVFVMLFGYLVLGNLVLAVLNDAYANVLREVDTKGYHWMKEYQTFKYCSVSTQHVEKLDSKPPRGQNTPLNHID